MKITEQNLPLSWSAFYVGLKMKFITSDEIINSILEEDFCSQETLIDLIDSQENEDEMLKKLETLSTTTSLEEGHKVWQVAYLTEIKNSDKKIKEKLEEVEQVWSRFGYPDSWREFIYYLPIDQANSPEDVYVNLISFINRSKEELNST